MKITTQKDAWGGTYFTVWLDAPSAQAEVPVEQIPELDRFVCSYRDEPFFMRAKAGSRVEDIPLETQWLGVRHADGSCSVYFSMAFEVFRTCFYGREGQLWVSAITGDDAVTGTSFCACYRIDGENFYELVRRGAESLSRRFGTCRLRWEKQMPEIMDLFGWCTWDSFYDQVTGADIPVGLESFKKGGFVPRFLILDDGWQTTADQHLSRGRWKLSSLAANEKFAPALKETVDAAKALGVEKFYVWHAILGYWGGIDPASVEMAKYRPCFSKAVHTRQIREVNPARWESEHFDFGMIDAEKAGAFYDDYHGYLKAQGVDGVKVDVQSSIEAHAQGRGGRVKLTKAVREGMENAVQKHFGGGLINCMSNANDMVYHCKDSNLMRSSNDFFPDEPLSHSEHIYRNAVNSIWLSQFTWCDWDMFQTSHAYGTYHAVARAISGGPVYVSDRVEEHDFALIRALTGADGGVLRALDVAMPTPDCLFTDPGEGKTLYKIFNRNVCANVVGVFSFQQEAGTRVSPRDVPGSGEGTYAVYRHKTGETTLLTQEESLELRLSAGEFDIITTAKVENGFAALGLMEKLNCGGAVKAMTRNADGIVLSVADGGRLLLYSREPVKEITVNGHRVDFFQEKGFVTAFLPENGFVNVKV